jgi:hypothetical protein
MHDAPIALREPARRWNNIAIGLTHWIDVEVRPGHRAGIARRRQTGAAPSAHDDALLGLARGDVAGACMQPAYFRSRAMQKSTEDGVRCLKLPCDPRTFAVPSRDCPGSWLLALWLTGCWSCPACGGPEPAVAASLDEEYTLRPIAERVSRTVLSPVAQCAAHPRTKLVTHDAAPKDYGNDNDETSGIRDD